MLRLYNSLTREKEDFIPISKPVTVYSCGPTVYNYAHIGNMRTYIFMDLLRRVLMFDGYEILSVMNITDVGHLVSDADTGADKIMITAKKENKSPYEIAALYTDVFFSDCKKLNIGKPEIIAKATENIREMIDYVVRLQELGYAYETEDGIYFEVEKFPGYGKLSGIKLEDQLAGARVEINSGKKHPADFALWKKASKEHIMQWESPWGMGYPGWHIECSAMSKKYLGERFDIHSGGIDHIPIHHENEIAQSEALEGHRTVNYWLHGEFLLVDNGKMSKSLGNVYTVAELERRGYSALDFRFFCLNAHYHKKLNFTWDGLMGAKTALSRLRKLCMQSKDAEAQLPDSVIEDYRNQICGAFDDDLNVPLALGVVFSMLREHQDRRLYEVALFADRVFGLSLEQPPAEPEAVQEDIPEYIAALARSRAEAKKERNFARADELRKEIAKEGYSVIDTQTGYTVKRI